MYLYFVVVAQQNLLVETDSGIVTINPHAARERIVYERLLDAVGGSSPSQTLLIPETVQLGPVDFARVRSSIDAIRSMGFQLEEFGRKQQISQKTIINMQRVFEELVMQALIPSSDTEINLTFTAEYSEANSAVELHFRYTGEEFNLIDRCDQISRKIVDSSLSSYSHSYSDGMNTVICGIRGGV